MRRWTGVPAPTLTGEDTGTSPYQGIRPARVENARLTGVGVLEQEPDWRVADTCKDTTPTENDAVCGIFPFATQGTASAASAGIAFSFDNSANKLWLHQLGEDSTILRTLQAYTGYTEAAPPQMTGFEYFGKFVACPDGREAAASRLGLGIYDPAANTFTIPTLDLVAGSAAAAALRFKGIAKHQGATVMGWGYGDEETGNVDLPHILRGARYATDDLTNVTNWRVDNTDAGPWEIAVGTLGLPIVACATAGPASIIGKATEVFALTGAFIGQMGYNFIGTQGPVSTTGMTSTGTMAVWMAKQGPAVSINGGEVRLIHPDWLTRRMLTYFDLAYTCAVHQKDQNRVGFLLRRRTTIDGAPLTGYWADQILWWDYARDELYVQGTPTTCFCIGTTDGPGISLAGPAGTPANLVSTPTSSSASLGWDHSVGDPSAAVSIEYRVTGTSTFTVVGPAPAGAVAWLLSGLTPSTGYDWRLRYFKNNQYGSYTSTATFTTAAGSAVGTPSGLAGTTTSTYSTGGKTYSVGQVSWIQGDFSSGARTDVLESLDSTFSHASVLYNIAAGTTSVTTEQLVTSPAAVRYYWVRHVLADGTVGTEVGPVSIEFGLA